MISHSQQTVTFKDARAEVFSFTGEGPVKEYHVMFHVTNPLLNFHEQLSALDAAHEQLCREHLDEAHTVFQRYFVSDAANQADEITSAAIECSDNAISVVQQAPLDGTKVAMWCYMMTDVLPCASESGLYAVEHGAFRHLWSGGSHLDAPTSEAQTSLLLNQYVMQLFQEGCSLADNCVRTWFFVNDIDNHYGGVVKARNDIFYIQNLNEDTHYIASTGIGGRGAHPHTLTLFDNYAIAGLQRHQVKYLYASDHLNRTSEYGVSFERGTTVDYADRRHIFISGTASIDSHGQILHRGDVVSQTRRMWENVEALLKEADATFEDIGQMIVYLRDSGDFEVVRQLYAERFPHKPVAFVRAAVCRPGWLIEMECMGVKKISRPDMPQF